MIKIGDQVKVIFSDMHTEVGQVKDILNTSDYQYVVTIKIYGKDADIYCNEKDLVKYD